MYIHQVIIDGFKSYATRTVIPNWDPEFNAITGLNGSGKSNILDSICFVLGISSLSHVRASNLQDLVYKRGQAGINKASVTIVFNNSDRSKSPPGYENVSEIHVTRQVIVNGRNKYMINGSTKNQQDVANFFQSVQLNVNNPHFLIMQGKITKVLNMKPPEILSMIEEAAGTRMFEDRKEKALKTLEKKDIKLNEINMLLESEISPKLEQLRQSKRTFLEYQKIDSEISHLNVAIVASDYNKAKKTFESISRDLTLKNDRSEYLDKQSKYLANEIQEIETTLSELSSQSVSSELEEKVKELSHALVKLKSAIEFKESAIKDEQDQRSNYLESQQENVASKLDLSSKLQSLRDEMNGLGYEKLSEQITNWQELLTSLSGGQSENGYILQIENAQKKVVDATKTLEEQQLKYKSLKKELKEMKPKVKMAEKTHDELVKSLGSLENVIQMMENELKSLNVDSERLELLQSNKAECEQELAKLNDEMSVLNQSVGGLEFHYSDPVPNFDRSLVKGLVAELFTIPKEHLNASTALEVVAGDRLYNLIVQNEVVGSQLLEKGRLVKRVTIIPLNKIQQFEASSRILAAKKISPGNVHCALDLIGYEEEILAAMKYVFGMSLVCSTPQVAKNVTFDKNVQMRSITLDGDTYDPSGTLSGGSKPQVGKLLKIQQLKTLKQKAFVVTEKLSAINRELNELEKHFELSNQLVSKIELKKHEYHLNQERIKSNPSSQMLVFIQESEKQCVELEKAIEASSLLKKEANEALAIIQKDWKEFQSDRQGKLDSLMQNISQGKSKLLQQQEAGKEYQQQISFVEQQLVELDREMETSKESLEKTNDLINQLLSELNELKAEYQSTEKEYTRHSKELEQEKQLILKKNKSINQLFTKSKQFTQELENIKLEKKELEIALTTLKEQHRAIESNISSMEKQNPWVLDQVNVQVNDVEESRKKLKQLEDQKSTLSKSLDTSVLDKFERVEKQEASLKQMLSTVTKDKKKIEETIAELETFKRESLERTFTKVSHDFGLIFGDLLPGNTCKLEPLEQDLMQGLNIRVRMGQVWKSSLTELSGGQRSLIALSLILALLQFKPAPMYILDEVDSALDLSHTQNIGTLLKTRFKGSQFIIVSLKDGMFQNANVLFRTKFVEGVSKVDRISQ